MNTRRKLSPKQEKVQKFINDHFHSDDTLEARIGLLFQGYYGSHLRNWTMEAVESKGIKLPARVIAALAQADGLKLPDVSAGFKQLPMNEQDRIDALITSIVKTVTR